MHWAKISDSHRTLVYSAAVVCLAVAALLYQAESNTADASSAAAAASTNVAMVAPAATFAANAGTLGPIPDGPGTPTACGSDGAPRDVTFTVSGMTAPLTNVEVSMTFAPAHSWRGDLTGTLIAPNATSFILYKWLNTTTAAGCGSSNDFAGPYNFKDSAAGTNIWTQASTPTTAGDYRTTAAGGAGQTNPAPVTNLTAAFAGLSTPNVNGTWTLRLIDGGGGDTGSVSAATLTLVGGAVVAQQHVVDFDGDGKTDVAVVRNVGGGPNGQVNWFFNTNPGVAATTEYAWGLATDFFLPADYDGDQKSDVAVWRPGAATVATWYILQSNGFTLRQEAFGQSGDDPSVMGDYSGDGKADLAVYRAGVNAGDPSTWFYRSVANGPVAFIRWGQNGDFPVPGDFDGDGKYDFTIQRNNGGGQAAFWRLNSNLTTGPITVFGTPTDVVVPGDYDGDGKSDIATVRGLGGAIEWRYLSSLNGSINFITFGTSATDTVTQGDWDGDGKTDVGIWRPSATAGASAFWYRSTTSGVVASVPFGSNGDYPPANFNSH